MNNREIAVVVSNDNKDVNVIETINAIQNAGFKNVFVQWYNKGVESYARRTIKIY